MVSAPSSSSSESRTRSSNWQYQQIYGGYGGEYSPARDNSFDGIRQIPARCICGLSLSIQTAWTLKNPGRRFVQCPRRKGQSIGCGLWEWVDPIFPVESVAVINELVKTKKELLLELKQKEVELANLKQKEVELANLKQKEVELTNLKLRSVESSGIAQYLDVKLVDDLRAHDVQKNMLQKTLRFQTLVAIATASIVVFAATISLFKR